MILQGNIPMKITAPGVPAVIVAFGGLQGLTASRKDTESVKKKRKHKPTKKCKKTKPSLL